MPTVFNSPLHGLIKNPQNPFIGNEFKLENKVCTYTDLQLFTLTEHENLMCGKAGYF